MAFSLTTLSIKDAAAATKTVQVISDGTLYSFANTIVDYLGSNLVSVDSSHRLLISAISGAVASGAVASGAIASGAFASGSIGSGAVASGAVATGAFASGAIGSGAVASGAVASGAIASGAFASGSIGSGAVASGAIASGAFASGALSSVLAYNTGAAAATAPRVCLADIGVGEYETVAASATAQVLGATGATGDYISGLLVVPGTTSPGNVLLLDNATSITVFAGGSTSVSNLVPFLIPLGMYSVSGAWKVTTGTNVTAIGIGNFT